MSGPHLLRPSTPYSGSVHAFLDTLAGAGFEGAPRPAGIDEDGRERLVFIDGNVAVPPYPDWSQTDTALASVARLLRGLHDAARRFDPQGLIWADTLADPAGAKLVCHNDVELSNVVFHNGIAVVADAYGLDQDGREELLGAMDDAIDRIEATAPHNLKEGGAQGRHLPLVHGIHGPPSWMRADAKPQGQNPRISSRHPQGSFHDFSPWTPSQR